MSRPQRDSIFYNEQEQGNEVNRILNIIQLEAAQMGNYLQQNDESTNSGLSNAIACCDRIGKELRTISLSPKNYYHLYLATYNAMMPLFLYLRDEFKGSLIALYEQVQFIYNAVPRLYLMCCVGAAVVVKKAAAVSALMKDLVEMCRAVQHPTKGLFVRNYLMDMFKDKLPDGNTTGKGNGSIMDSVDFLLINFIEMNKLTVRLQAGIKEKEKKADEERQLLQLVGKNIQSMSNLEGMNYELYRQTIMPKIMDQILSCGDLHAQEFLMDVIISAFPANYHLGTLEELLRCFPSLHKSVDTRPLLLNLMKVLLDFIKNQESEMDPFMMKLNIFQTFSQMLINICVKRKTSAADFLAIMAQFQELQMTWYKDDRERTYHQTAQIFEMISNYLQEGTLDQYAVTHLMKLMQSALNAFGVKQMLNVVGFRNVFGLLPYNRRKSLATELIAKCIKNNEYIETVVFAKQLINIIADLISKVEDEPEQLSEEEKAIDVENGSKILHLIKNNTIFEEVLTLYKNRMTADATRIKYCAQAFVFAALEKKGEETLVQFVFQFVIQIIKMLEQLNENVLSFNLSLHCGVAGSQIKHEKFMYFFKHAFEIYENIAKSAVQYQCIMNAIGILNAIKVTEEEFTEIAENIQKCIRYLFRTSQRVELYCEFASCYIKNNSEVRKEDECYKMIAKAQKEIDCLIDEEEQSVLFVTLLRKTIYYYGIINEVNAEMMNEIIKKIRVYEEMMNSAVREMFMKTVTYIKEKAVENPKFAEIEA